MNDVDLLRALVGVASPTGAEQEAVSFLQEQARRDGFTVREDEPGNFIAEKGQGDRLLLFVGHIDTVPGHIPVRIQDGELWGRGSVDAKGSLAAAYCAARRLQEPDVRIVIVGAVDEEGRSRGARGLQVEGQPEWIINGEPSGAHALTLGYKGILRGTIHVERASGHGAGPHEGAPDLALDCWNDMRRHFSFQAAFDAVQGRLDSINSGTDGITDSVTARFQLRLPPGMDLDQAGEQLDQIAERHDAHVVHEERIPGVLAPRRTPLVAAFTSAIRQQGNTPRLLRKTGTSDMNLLTQRYPGVPIAAYGPGDSSLDHTTHERLSLEEYHESIAVLARVFRRFGSASPAPQEPLAEYA